MTILAGDIGATKTILGLFESGPLRPEIKHSMTYPSQRYESLENIITEFMFARNEAIESACFGVPGPVFKGECRTTNLNWVVSTDKLKNHLNTSQVILVNDLVATAIAAPELAEHEYAVINLGVSEYGGSLGIVAPGTGLGMALMIWTGASWLPVASEGGHVDFAPTDELQVSLLQYIMKKYSRVSVERLAAGPGLLEIFNWSAHRLGLTGSPLHSQINGAVNPSESITRHAIELNDPACSEALDMFVSILGSICGNLALTAMTTGGIFLGGGVTPKIMQKLASGKFLDSFTNKGRFRELMKTIPVKTILNDRAALIGASIRASRNLSFSG